MDNIDFIWQNGVIKRWEDATVHCLTHGLHYGSGVFEGIRCYPQTNMNLTGIFRLQEHLDRLSYSAKSLGIQIPYSHKKLTTDLHELINLNKIKSGYIRILAHYGYGSLRVNPEGLPIEMSMAVFPLNDFLPHKEVNVKTSEYIRIHPKSTIADAKICGHYSNSILANLALKNTEYDEILFLDANNNIAEGAAQNIFFIKNKTIYTPSLGNILSGITRDSIIKIAKTLGYKVIIKNCNLSELKQADEAFFTGTAVEITPIKKIDNCIFKKHLNPEFSITSQLKNYYQKAVRGECNSINNKIKKWISINKKIILA